ncbi:TPA: hypothetical protein DEB00_00485 [Candidatus Uhrbacteria bacterium]|nr:hypothetical protein [Candidatus Uhrbacteria bacterium]
MPAKKSTTKRSSKKAAYTDSSVPAAHARESSFAFWMALFIVSIAIVGGGVLTTLPRAEDVDEAIDVDAEEVESLEESISNEVDAVTIKSIYDQYALEGYPSAADASAEIQSMLSEALRTGLLVEAGRLRLGALDTIRIMTVPDTDINQDYCGAFGQSLCVVMRQKNVHEVDVLGFFSSIRGENVIPGHEMGTFGDAQMVGDKLLITMVMGDAGEATERVYTIDLTTKERVLIGSATSTSDDSGWSTAITRGDLEVTIDTNGEDPNYLLSSATDSTTVAKGQIDELRIPWDVLLDHPNEIRFGLGDQAYVYNRSGAGTFQIE